MKFQNLVVALAGKVEEEPMIRTAIRLADELQGRLSLLHVKHPGAGKAHMLMDAPRSVEEDDLRGLVREAGHHEEARRLEVRIIEGNAYHEVIAEATKTADLMIIGHSPRNAFVAALMESVDEKVANVTSCPVVIVPKS